MGSPTHAENELVLWMERLSKAWADSLPGREIALARLEERRQVCGQKWLAQAGRVLCEKYSWEIEEKHFIGLVDNLLAN